MIRKIVFAIGLFLQVNILGMACVGAQLPMGSASNFDDLIKENKVTQSVGGSYRETVLSIFSVDHVKIVNMVLGTVALLYLVILGIKLLFTGGAEDSIENYKSQFIHIVIGLMVISMSYFVATHILDPTVGQALEENNSIIRNFFAMVRSIEIYLRIIVAGISLLMIIIGGYNLLVNGNDDAIDNEKRFARDFFVGVAFILLSEVLVLLASRSQLIGQTDFIGFQEGAGVSSGVAMSMIDQLVGLTNYLLTFVAAACLFMFVLSALYFVANFGDEDRTGRAKTIIINSLIGIVVCVSGLTIIRIFILG